MRQNITTTLKGIRGFFLKYLRVGVSARMKTRMSTEPRGRGNIVGKRDGCTRTFAAGIAKTPAGAKCVRETRRRRIIIQGRRRRRHSVRYRFGIACGSGGGGGPFPRGNLSPIPRDVAVKYTVSILAPRDNSRKQRIRSTAKTGCYESKRNFLFTHFFSPRKYPRFQLYALMRGVHITRTRCCTAVDIAETRVHIL